MNLSNNSNGKSNTAPLPFFTPLTLLTASEILPFHPRSKIFLTPSWDNFETPTAYICIVITFSYPVIRLLDPTTVCALVGVVEI